MDKANHERLIEIRDEMMDLLEEASNIIRMDASKGVYARAKATWIGHVDAGLGGGNYIDTYDHTFKNTINELEPDDEEEADCICSDDPDVITDSECPIHETSEDDDNE